MTSQASLLSSLILLFSCASYAQETQENPKLVLTSIAPMFHIATALTANTGIRVENIPARPRSMAAQATLFARQGERFAEQFKNADAVITIGKIWAEDSFYTTAREFNIRIVNIDASKPWSHILTGVSVSTSPVTGKVSPYFWISPSNTIRMLNIVARDLQTLYPDQAQIISSNLEQEKNSYITLQADFETRFLEVLDPVVYALADEFSYLTSELGIFVDDYFVKQDIDWTEEDLTNLSATLTRSGIKVVIHKWEPSEEIKTAVSDAGAELVVLDLMETSTEDFHDSVQSNLEKLLQALISASK